ncbi:response regulator receiver domain protein CheY [Geminocystis sp. NIES-3708]|uniref:response regulator n=1 Tax=Geminocystis sp. NIES-3708 TaxID=1615909 RepID=UPI0005FC87B6|nr:response regulator [Geminocystis sp. NIES-3708]BAQ62809.1 response regulator receiver domain protein CheY [Geminocystis sp. NIES-3708]
MKNIKLINISKVLVIDDNKEIQKLIKISLEMMRKWEVFTANSGLEGLKIAKQLQNLDLILLDYLMPEINGGEIIIKLRKDKKVCHIPVIFLTAQSDTQFDWQGLGALGVIYKPFNPITIVDLIEKILIN